VKALLAGVPILLLLCVEAQAEACRASRGAVQPSGAYWSWRLIDGRRCWYVGKPNKPKTQLHWQADPPPAKTRQVTHIVPAPVRAPDVIKVEEVLEPEPSKPPELTADALLATACCWPQLDQPLPVMKTVKPPPPPPSRLPFWVAIVAIAATVSAVLAVPNIVRKFS
jgi:hypothetical protein